MDTRIIKEKLLALKNLDKSFNIFGASSHNYQNFPVLIEEVEKVENRHNFSLPEGFRSFLIEIGYGAGPYYGIKNLDEISERIIGWYLIDYISIPIELILSIVGLGRVRNPFADRKAHPERDFPLNQKHIDRINERLKTEEWEYPGDCGEKLPYSSDGNILICDQGCHFGIVLATSGEFRGGVWDVEFDGDNTNWLPAEYKSNLSSVQDTNFEMWYEDWLDASLAKFSIR